jgi:hypothetical protein
MGNTLHINFQRLYFIGKIKIRLFFKLYILKEEKKTYASSKWHPFTNSACNEIKLS